MPVILLYSVSDEFPLTGTKTASHIILELGCLPKTEMSVDHNRGTGIIEWLTKTNPFHNAACDGEIIICDSFSFPD